MNAIRAAVVSFGEGIFMSLAAHTATASPYCMDSKRNGVGNGAYKRHEMLYKNLKLGRV